MKQSFYSEDLETGIELIWFQSNSSKYKTGVACLERAVANNEPDAYYFLARCYAWEDGDIGVSHGVWAFLRNWFLDETSVLFRRLRKRNQAWPCICVRKSHNKNSSRIRAAAKL